ncbi:MAG: hypothetical protein CL855_04685 [Cryomorphaceae bacterium]|nr:hypothetical protein [Cryomorphaceae bacterium]|tara:strand:- start:211 stop:831 length:621 start_codon:yes stop_codon:yes gene_type:complete
MSTETELSSVNSILGAIGQAPVSRIYQNEDKTLVYLNPEIAFVHNLLMDVNTDVQTEGWVFNTEYCYEMLPNDYNEINIPPNVIRLDKSEGQVYRDCDPVKRGTRLYDKYHHTYKFNRPIKLDYVFLLEYAEIPTVFQRLVTLRASGRAATQLVSNPELTQMLSMQEAQARAACMEYECNQSDSSFFGTPSGVSYRSYQPYRTLQR